MFIDLDKHPTGINDLPMLDQYTHYFNHYTRLYPKCSVMYQNGDFYEFFGTTSPKFGNVEEISAITNLNVSSKAKIRQERGTTKYPLFAGFKVLQKSKWLGCLLSNGWTIVQVDQEVIQVEKTTRKGTKIEDKIIRGVRVIHSADTYVDESTSFGQSAWSNRWIVSILIEAFKDPKFDPMTIGMAAIDVATGETVVYEAHNSMDDQDGAYDEMTRFIHAHSPIHTMTYSNIDGLLTTPNGHTVSKLPKTPLSEKQMLGRLYPKKGLTNLYEYVNLDRRPTATTAFCLLAQYCIDHNPQIVNMISVPQVFSNESIMTLANNAIEQLEVVGTKGPRTSSVFNLVNYCSTAMGHRLLRQRLSQPVTSVDEINRRYDMVDVMSERAEKILATLKKIGDLEKVYRRLLINHNPRTDLITSFTTGIWNAIKVVRKYSEHFVINTSQLEAFLSETIDVTKEHVFLSEQLDELISTRDRARLFFDKEKERFEGLVNGIVDFTMSEQGCLYKFSKSKHAIVADKVNIISSNKTYKYCTTDKIQQKYQLYQDALEQIETLVHELSVKFISDIRTHSKTIRKLLLYVAEIDVYCSSAKVATLNKYVRPVISRAKSYINTTNIRHPVIEQIIDGIYVPHNVEFSGDKNGMLLYGFNAAGKSSLMKTIGINLILAQAGLFVAAETFTFYPYTSIQTRILSNDNQQKGQSSFAVEMAELSGILARANSSALILGDEISRGTETVSGVAIVASAISQLVEKGAHFLFATHLHQLVDIDEVKELTVSGQVSVFHLQVTRNPETNVLTYDRDLTPGCGDSLYGLEVARAMRLPDSFLVLANRIRNKLTGIKDVRSRYNSEMFLRWCGVCGAGAVEVHHIKFQSEADDKGFIGHFHKNDLMNLVGLCQRCHKQVHKGRLTISKWQETSEGFELIHSDPD